MSVLWRPPTVAQVVQCAMSMSGCDEEILCDQRTLLGLERAVDDGIGSPQSLPEACAYMVDGLLRALPDAAEPPRTVAQLQKTALEASNASWRLHGLSTSMQLQSWQRRPAGLPALAGWIDEFTVVRPPPEVGAWKRSPGADPDQMSISALTRVGTILAESSGGGGPAILLVGPLANLQGGRASPHIEFVQGQVVRGLEASLAHLFRPAHLRLFHPSLEVNGDVSDDQLFALVERLSTEEADAVILCDIGGRAPGFGAAVQLMFATRAAQTNRPTLVLCNDPCEARSRLQRPLLRSAVGAWVPDPPPTLSEIPQRVAEWMDLSYERILGSRRRRINRRVVYLRGLRSIKSRIMNADDETLLRALRRAGMTSSQFGRAIRSVDAWEQLPFDQRRELELSLADPRHHRTRSQAAVPPRSIANLKAAAKKHGWPDSETAQLLASVKRELAVAGAEHRLAPYTLEDWEQVYVRFFGSN